MSAPVIKIESLSKRYRLGEVGSTALHEDLSRWWASLRGRPDPTLRLDQLSRQGVANPLKALRDDASHVWALRDVSFELQQGETLGIIGANGSGKSTLLKILSRVTAPTQGCVKIRGRVASLLEVGTGFNPELTGRENIYLNGAILGMRRAEIRDKFDEIVDFSGCATYIDTPVKRYSSGMYVRLAFAVAAHLDPDILIVDEVLAVGDAEFQRKCLGKIKDVAGHGRTVLFVSHNMGAIQKICPQSIVLSKGSLVCGPMSSADAVHRYLSFSKAEASGPRAFHRDVFTLEDFRILSPDGNPAVGPLLHDRPCSVEIAFTLDRYDAAFNVGYVLYNEDGETVYMTLTTDAASENWPPISKGRNRVRSIIPPYFLNEGEYQLGLIASFHCAQWLVHPDKDAIRIPFSVRMGAGESPYWHGRRPGGLAPLPGWTTLE
jgi:lipopolysaccharide transport system ATP-binding protein